MAAAAASPHAGGRLSSATALLDTPLPLPSSLSKQTFYLSPIANPDLVLALIIPGHPLYSGHGVPGSPVNEGVAAAAAHEVAAAGKAVTHFWQSAANTVTNSAASAIGVKNSLEISKPKLRLVPRAPPGSDPTLSLNQKWLVLKRDGCIYSCVEESAERGGGMFRLGGCRNQMLRAESRDAGAQSAEMGATPGGGGAATPLSPPGSELMQPTVTRESSASIASSSGRLSTVGDDSSPAARAAAGLISVTTAGGETVLCPMRWRVGAAVNSDQIKEGLAVQGMHCVIEDVESGSSSSGRDSSKLLVIKNSCCGNLDCELEKIDAGSAVAFRSEKDAELTTDGSLPDSKGKGGKMGGSPATPSTPSSTGSSALLSAAGSKGPNIKQVWRVESDFSLWLSTLSRSVSTEYGITRKLQAIEADRKRVRRETRDPEPHVPLKLSIDYEYVPVWSTEGTKATSELSIWRPRSLGAAGAVFLGDFAHGSKAPPPSKQSLFVAPALNGSLHRALVRPRDFELVYFKRKGKLGNLYIWNPLPPVGVDALALGHIATTGKDETLAKPEVNCGIVLVMREYCKDVNHALSSLLWTDANTGGGAIGSLWRVPHLHTFFCNPCSHQQPSGSYWVLLEPQEIPEKCPLLRPMETTNVHWEAVWDDKGTLAKMDISVWRPEIEKTFVRFGDQVCRGHAEPTNLAVVAKDHPAFRRPIGYQLVTKLYRGARKCYVYKPLPPTDEHVALGYVVMPTKEEQPQLDLIRCVHRDALIPLGVLKQMWIEHHEGMISALTLGLGNLLKVSKEYPINMLWKNRSLNTFIAVQNTHARPEEFAAGAVYRLTMTAGELAWTVSQLESHARWVLESLYGVLSNMAKVLQESSYKRLSLSAQQVAALFQAVKSIFHLMRSDGSVAPPSLTSPGSSAAESRSAASSVSSPGGASSSSAPFKVSASFTEYLSQFERERMRSIEKSLKRYLYTAICEDISDHEATLEMLDECWELVNMMPDVHKVADAVDEWVPACTTRFPASQLKSLPSILLDDKIGNEVFERFLKLFPPRAPSHISMDDEPEDKQEDEELPQLKHAASTKTAGAGAGASGPTAAGFTEIPPDADSARAELMQRRASLNAAAVAQLEDTKATLAKLSTLSDELELVIVITSSMEIRKRYLEYYQNYLTHTLSQEFPVQGNTARSASTGHKLGMSSLLAVVRWVCEYIELVGDHLLEGNHEEARSVLGKMEDLVDKLMDVHDELTKEKILTWISNLLRQEERANVELLDGDPDTDSKGKKFYYTSGAQDLFLNINMLFDSQSENLTGRPLARIALVHVHVLTYYQQVQGQFFRQVAAINDGTTHETVKGKTPVSNVKHAGSLDKRQTTHTQQGTNSSRFALCSPSLPPSHSCVCSALLLFLLSLRVHLGSNQQLEEVHGLRGRLVRPRDPAPQQRRRARRTHRVTRGCIRSMQRRV